MTELDGSPAPEFKDRKIGLVLFGTLTVLFGLCCALVVPLMFFAVSVAAKSANPPPAIPSLLGVSIMYGGIAAVLV
jgi:hypothetical protein